ncbi:MAG: hypothetical protein A3F40_04585 [Chlamydiae bacterium RIFCSPHIGHO2_12_FULL_27_8]|nr:MAG: hypothetical protein A3F40_04585 [Chlamydiae bacterium RIFCSPHIGHO2_12_FULL_27_8]
MQFLLLIIPYFLTTTIQINPPKKTQEPTIIQEEKTDVSKDVAVSQNTIKALTDSTNKSIMIIDIDKRTQDIINVFNNLKKEFSYAQISIKLYDGTILTNISDITPAQDGTMIILKQNTNQGTKQFAFFTEDIKGITAF